MTDEQRLADLEGKLQAVINKNQHLEDQTEWLEEQLRQANDEIAELRSEVDRLSDTNEMLEQVGAADSGKPARRAAVLIRTLRTRANASDGRASLDVTGALDVLRLDRDKRTLMYSTFEKAEGLVGDREILWYRNEPRHSDKNSRLIIDIREGDVPSVAEGHELRVEGD